MNICQYKKGGIYSLISYEPLWNTMQKVGASTYTLQVKGGISSSTIRRLKSGESVSTNTIDALCQILHCSVQDVIEFLPKKSCPENVIQRQLGNKNFK